MNDYGMRLWQNGVRSDVEQFFYDLPLNDFQSDSKGLLFTSMARDGGDGPESSLFIVI